MSSSEPVSSIADASRPNAGRIYDFLLGGSHNFEIDRQAAQGLLQMVPEMLQWARLIRWFLGEAVRRLLAEGFTHFLDFASGLPTVDHIHQIAPKGTKVIYSDIDPVTVAYAQDIIKGSPDVVFVQCDAGQPEKLLQSGIVEKMFGQSRRVAIGFNGIAWFLPDEKVSHAIKVLYDWAGPNSKLFICDIDERGRTEASKGLLGFYQKVGQPVYLRPQSSLMQLLLNWKVEDPGFLPLEEWVEVKKEQVEQAKQRLGGGNMFGAILRK
jgi:hypothetical protein